MEIKKRKGDGHKEKENVENSKVTATFLSTSFAFQVHFVIGKDENLCGQVSCINPKILVVIVNGISNIPLDAQECHWFAICRMENVYYKV